MDKIKVLVTPTSLQPGNNDEILSVLKEFTPDLEFNPTGRPLTEEELIPMLQGCVGYIAGLDQVTEKVLAACPDLKVISRYGAGYDRVDIQAAKKRNIKVTNTPGVNAEAVGELAFGLLLSIARNIPHLNSQIRKGGWERSIGMELKGKTLGIMGLGAIGKVVARCAQGFEMQIMAYDPYINTEYCREKGIQDAAFEEVVRQADIISLHLPYNEQTAHLFNREVFEKMKAGSILINASRGGIIDEDAAYEALKSGRLRGLGLDAFEVEPPGESRLFEFPTVIATPHTGAHTKEATMQMAEAAVRNLVNLLSGKDCPYIVNP